MTKYKTNLSSEEIMSEKMRIVMNYDLDRIKRSLKMYEEHLAYMRVYQKKVSNDPVKAERRRDLNREKSKLRMRDIRAEAKEKKLLLSMNEDQRKTYFIKKELKNLEEKEKQEKMSLLEEQIAQEQEEEEEEEFNDLD